MIYTLPDRSEGYVLGFIHDELHRVPKGGAKSTLLQTKKHRIEIIEEGKEEILIESKAGKMRCRTSKGGGVQLVNELGDIRIRCRNIKIAGSEGVCLFGNYTRGNPENEIEGVKNLYDYVVVPFINGMMQHAEPYLNFNRRWLSCPKYNNLYQRGVYTIPSGKIKILYKKDGTTEMLTEGTKIHFKPGADKHAFDKGEQKHRYEVIKINSESCAGEVELTLEDKKNCDDSKFPQNYSNYVEIAKSVTNKNDKKALSIYKQSNGVPYYMNGMDSNNNKGARKLRADEILNWSEQEKNWYSYKKKPNTGDFGIDCSGFVSNCLTAFCYENKEKHFLNLNSYFQNYVRATSIRDSLCREIPITENTKGLSYLQKGDVVVSSTHIAFSYEINLDAHLAMDKIVGTNKNYFTILQANGNSLVSNDDNKDTEASCLYLTTPPNKYTEGFFLRILKGPFRHWGLF